MEARRSLERLNILKEGKVGPLFEKWRKVLLSMEDREAVGLLEGLKNNPEDDELQRRLVERLSKYNFVRLVLAGVYELDEKGFLRLTEIGNRAHYNVTRNERLMKIVRRSGEEPEYFVQKKYKSYGSFFKKLRKIFVGAHQPSEISRRASLEWALRKMQEPTFHGFKYKELMKLLADEIIKEAERIRREQGSA